MFAFTRGYWKNILKLSDCGHNIQSICNEFSKSAKNFCIASHVKQHLKISTFNMNFRASFTTDFTTYYTFIINPETAALVVRKIVNCADNFQKRIIIELNPGKGLLTKNLIQNGASQLIIYDIRLMNQLMGIVEKYKKQIQIEKWNVFHFKNFNILTAHSIAGKWFKGNSIIIGVNPTRTFFRTIAKIVILMDDKFASDVEFYFVMSGNVLGSLTTLKHQHSLAADVGLFYLLMEFSTLAELPRSHCVPLNKSNPGHKMYLIRVIRKDVTNLGCDYLLKYYCFLNQICNKKRNHVFGLLENWCPGVGISLVAKGFFPLTQLREYKPEELLMLFNLFEKYDNGKILDMLVQTVLQDKTHSPKSIS